MRKAPRPIRHSKPVHVLQRGDEVSDVVNMTAIAVVEAQETEAPA